MARKPIDEILETEGYFHKDAPTFEETLKRIKSNYKVTPIQSQAIALTWHFGLLTSGALNTYLRVWNPKSTQSEALAVLEALREKGVMKIVGYHGGSSKTAKLYQLTMYGVFSSPRKPDTLWRFLETKTLKHLGKGRTENQTISVWGKLNDDIKTAIGVKKSYNNV